MSIELSLIPVTGPPAAAAGPDRVAPAGAPTCDFHSLCSELLLMPAAEMTEATALAATMPPTSTAAAPPETTSAAQTVPEPVPDPAAQLLALISSLDPASAPVTPPLPPQPAVATLTPATPAHRRIIGEAPQSAHHTLPAAQPAAPETLMAAAAAATLAVPADGVPPPLPELPAAVTERPAETPSPSPALAPTLTARSAEAPAAAAAVPIPADFAEGFNEQVIWNLGRGLQEARIHLHPQDLGVVDVQLVMDGEQASLVFVVEQPQARAAVQAALPQLALLLTGQGLQLADAQVQSQHRGGTASAPRAPPNADEPVEVLLSRPRLRRGLVDHYA